MRSFALLALSAQVLMVAQQLVLLPLQTHTWGHELTAAWLGAMATSAVLLFADLGLRNAGFAELTTARDSPRFATLWTIMRVHVLLVWLAVELVLVAFLAPRVEPAQLPFLLLIGVAALFDSIFGFRTVWMEALGRITRNEMAFFACLALRVIGGAALIVFADAGPLALAILWCASGLLGLLLQRTAKEMREAAPMGGRWRFAELGWGYRQMGWSSSSVLATWAQIHLPVISLTAFAAAPVVAGFVALRAVFGLLNRTMQQISRVLSIQFVARIGPRGRAEAGGYLLAAAAAWAWIAAGAALVVFAENFWLTGPLFDLQDAGGFRLLTLTLALSALFASNQIFTLSIARAGDLRTAGIAGFIYVGTLVATCVAAALSGSFTLLAVGLAASEIVLFAAVLAFFLGERDPVARPPGTHILALSYLACTALIVLGWVGATWASAAGLGTQSPTSLALNVVAAFAGWLVLGVCAAWLAPAGSISGALERLGLERIAGRVAR